MPLRIGLAAVFVIGALLVVRPWDSTALVGTRADREACSAEPRPDSGVETFGQRRPDPPLPTGHPDLDPEQLAEIQDLLERGRRRAEDRATVQAVLDALDAETLRERPPPPPVIRPRPESPTVAFAVPRALAWLAAQQQPDGKWDGPDADAIATMVFATDDFYEEQVELPRRRLFYRFRRSAGLESLRAASPRTMAVALCAQCAVVENWSRRNSVRDLERGTLRLVGMRNPDAGWGHRSRDGRFDAIATGWAALALGRVVDLEASGFNVRESAATVAKIDGSRAGGNPEKDPSDLVAFLLVRPVDDPSEDAAETRRWMTRRLVESLHERDPRALDEWFLGAVALKRHGGAPWNAWRNAMTKALLHSQRPDASWSEDSAAISSRIRATALAVLCLRLASEP